MSFNDDDDDLDGWTSPDESNVPNLQPGMDTWGRVGLPGQVLLGAVPQNRIERSMMDPLERFRMYVDAISRNLNNWDGVNLSEQSIERLLVTAEKLEVINHKNPTAYILGFLATDGGKKLTKARFNNVIEKVLPHAQEGSVLPPDVIRYARLWENLSNKN